MGDRTGELELDLHAQLHHPGGGELEVGGSRFAPTGHHGEELFSPGGELLAAVDDEGLLAQVEGDLVDVDAEQALLHGESEGFGDVGFLHEAEADLDLVKSGSEVGQEELVLAPDTGECDGLCGQQDGRRVDHPVVFEVVEEREWRCLGVR